MSIDDASALLWQQDAILNTAFSTFHRPVLQELSVRNGLLVGKSGKAGGSLKIDYVKALYDFVSQTFDQWQ